MNTHKEFEAKNLDAAISEACEYFGVPRGKLEIEILNDAKTGIFGLVGVKKARIRASKVSFADSVLEDAAHTEHEASVAQSPKGRAQALAEHSESDAAGNKRDQKPRPRKDSAPHALDKKKGAGRAEGEAASSGKGRSEAEAHSKPAENGAAGKNAGQQRGRERGKPMRDGDRVASGPRDTRQEGRARNSSGGGNAPALPKRPASENSRPENQRMDEGVRDEMPELTLADCDHERVRAEVTSVVQRLVIPIVGEVACTVEIHGDRVRATVDCGEASGLLVGRDGQTLASIQYLASRIAARRLGGAFRLHIDAGNYRERHDDRLKELALSLAEFDRARMKRHRFMPGVEQADNRI